MRPTMPILLLLLLIQETSTPFTEQVTQNFEKWDRDSDGRITAAELDALVEEPSITGKAAAALAALKIVQRGDQWKYEPITRVALAQYAAARKKRQKPDGPPYDHYFDAALKRISNAGLDLFRDPPPKLGSIRQGPLGDCYFIAPLGALLHRSPEAVRKMIQLHDDGTYCVTFGNRRTVRVAAPTETEFGMSSTAEKGSRWIAILEKAFATFQNESLPDSRKKESETDLIARGGPATQSIRVLTGRPGKYFALRGKTDADKTPTEEDAIAKLPKVREILVSSVREKRLVFGNTPKAVSVPGITPKHIFAVLSFDETTEKVGMWNPHGNKFTPKGEAGLQTGYETKDGNFAIPLEDFVKVFAGVSYEEP